MKGPATDAAHRLDLLAERVQRRLVENRQQPTGVAVAQALRAELPGVVSDSEMLRLIRELQREMSGAGVLQPLLADPATTDVVVNGADDVRVDRGSGWEPTGITFPDDLAVQRLARRLAAAAGRRLDEAVPFVDARLPDGTRMHAALGVVAPSGTCISLRTLRPTGHDLAALLRAGTLPGFTLAAIRAVLTARLAFLVSGGTGAGKTTLLGALLSEVRPDERIVLVEDAEELRPTHPHVVRLVARSSNIEGAGSLDLRELVRQALRMRPDRIVVGEVRGAEVMDMLLALNTGHQGSAGTVHANTAVEVPSRLAALGALAGRTRDTVLEQVAGAIQVVIALRREPAGRTVEQIAVVVRDSGQVRAIPALVAGRPVEPGAQVLSGLLESRGVVSPW